MSKRTAQLEALLAQFKSLARSPEMYAAQWKQRCGAKVVGCLGLDVPEPLIYAAGMLPVVVLDRDEEVTVGNAHVENHMCGYIRSVVDQALKGELSYCDEIVAHDCCHIVRMTCNAMHTYCPELKKIEFLYLSPLLHKKTAQDFNRDELARFRTRLEAMGGKPVTDEALREALAAFNEDKKQLLRLYELRRRRPGLLTGVEVSDIVAASMCMDKREHARLLEQLFPLLTEDLEPVVKGTPVAVHGSLCERCDDYVLNCVESTGGVIVDDDLYVGSRYFNTLYDESIDPKHRLSPPQRHRGGQYLPVHDAVGPHPGAAVQRACVHHRLSLRL